MLSGPWPPTTFGMLRVVNCALPGSTRSGENARKKSRPAASPFSSSMGWTTSSVVPGYVVDSRMTSCPLRIVAAQASTALTTYERSGSFVFRSGVGTQMSMTSMSPSRAMSDVARKRPALTTSASSASATSGM